MHSAHRPNDILVSCPGPLLALCMPICFCQLIQKLPRCEMCSFKSQKVIVFSNVSAYRSQLYCYLSCPGTQISTLPCQLITVSHCVTVDNLPFSVGQPPKSSNVLTQGESTCQPHGGTQTSAANYSPNFDYFSAFRY